ncbi:MAG: alanine--tRNA ligase, partial [Deltaproteobacteria bacterium]|nr:alanine--tRNA ligase [Deltaproteobacteria bacterium]
IESLKARLLSKQSVDTLAGVKEINGTPVLIREVKADSPKEMREYADQIKEKLRSGIIVLGAEKAGKAMLICVVTEDLTARFKAGEIISRISPIVGGKGGGRVDMAQGGGNRPEELGVGLETVYEIVKGSV